MIKERYELIVIELNEILRKDKLRRNLLTTAKISAFIAIVWSVWHTISQQQVVFLWVTLLITVAFILLNVLDSRLVKQITLRKALLRCAHTEIAYLDGDYSNLDSGDEYKTPSHPYSYDLDIFGEDSIFQIINRCHTPNGKNLLAHWISVPLNDQSDILLRQEAVRELADDLDWCHSFRANTDAFGISSKDNEIILDWQKEPMIFHSKAIKYAIFTANTVTIALVAISLFGLISIAFPLIAIFVQMITVLLLTKIINKQSESSGRAVRALMNYLNLVLLIDKKEFSTPLLQRLKSELIGEKGILRAFKQLSGIVDTLDQRSNVIALLVMNGLFMRDLHTVLRLNRWKVSYANELSVWVDKISHFEALVSMANFRINNDTFIFPEVDESTLIDTIGVGHPLLKEGVCNDFQISSLNEFCIITGANMSGKSTFLRAVGVNLVLALSGNVVCATSFRFSPVTLYTSMRTTDNLSKGTSYFHAELLRLKGIIDLSEKSDKLFIIIDEMLKGTNSHDKLNGSRLFMDKLLRYNISGIVATHDLELGELENSRPDNFKNACFEITHKGEQVIYDYKLNVGISRNMNASILLKQMGLV